MFTRSGTRNGGSVAFKLTIARGSAALLALLLCAGQPMGGSEAEASTPSLLWTGANHLAINCLVQSTTTTEAAAFEDRLCEQVHALAGRGAPVPVSRVEPGDPALVRADTVTLLVHGSVERAPAGRTITFTIRPYRPTGGDGDILFGTAPQAFSLPTAAISPAFEAGVAAAVADILPWQQAARMTARPL